MQVEIEREEGRRREVVPLSALRRARAQAGWLREGQPSAPAVPLRIVWQRCAVDRCRDSAPPETP